MLRSTLLGASAVILCTAASAQQAVQAKKVLGPVRDAGIYHVATDTWTRGGSTSNISPDAIYRNDTSSGYFGIGWDGCEAVDEIQLPGPGNPKYVGPSVSYTIDGLVFGYCKIGGGTVDWQYTFYSSFAPCDDPNSPGNCICQTPEVYTFAGLPGGSACWVLTVDLAGGYEVCLGADGGTCSPGYDGNGTSDHAGVGATWDNTSDGGTTGPILNGNPTWDTPGFLTCYQAGPSVCGGSTATGLGIQDLFTETDNPCFGATCTNNPGCYFFGGYLNLNGCNTPSNVPIGSFQLVLFSDCVSTCTEECGGVTCPDFPIDCDEGTNPNNVADIAIDSNSVGNPTNLSVSGGPAGQFTYPLVGTGTGIVQNPPGAKGALCLGGMAIGRYNMDASTFDTGGNYSVDISNSNTGGPNHGLPSPPGGNIMAGDTWRFQYWHRQPMGAPSTFSSAVTVTFVP